jgi:hypothetical protein
MSLALSPPDDFCECAAETCAMIGATSFSAATGVAVGECFGFGVDDCSGAAVADCRGAGVGVFGSEIGAGDRCAEINSTQPIRAKRIMGFICTKLKLEK